MDAGLAALGHGWPFAAAHGAMPSFRHAEPRRGTEWWGKALLLTFGALPKVSRRKGGTVGSRYRSNGYVLVQQHPRRPPSRASSLPQKKPTPRGSKPTL
ncbi:hypothetical protein CEQ51_02530 [Pseudomonas thivervalensis]|uniref:Uncharacterized protein n=1 Tax=Pseudomonas thivervalensis TaxID=86265 RepID=A0A2Z4Z630_9PSED|nr:hypothetical protein CE140_03215 [Pseudomonas thivervalensis]AXA58990.1 hypothetical protein CEQ51_02530 [Pseudomonas thivervalensis]